MLEVHGTEYLGNGHFGEQKTKEVLAFGMQEAFRLITSLNLVAELNVPIGGFHNCHDCPRNVDTPG
jgi:hypothetical protein